MPTNTWAIMVYLAGDNNLEEEMVFAIKEMCRIGAPKDVDIFVQFDRGGPPIRFSTDTFNGQEDIDLILEGQLLAAGDYDSNDPSWKNLKKFLLYCIDNAEIADRYMLILSGHGSGAIGDFMGGEVEGSGLTISSLKKALETAANDRRIQLEEKKAEGSKYIDILGMDSCLMGMVETAYAVYEQVDYMIAAEGFETNTGWPYARLLEKLKDTIQQNDPSLLEPDKMAERTVQHYYEYYNNYTLADVSTDMAALHLEEGKINALTESLNNLSDEMITGLDQQAVCDAIVLAHWEAQAYKNDQYADIYDFCKLLKGRIERMEGQVERKIEIEEKLQSVLDAINALVIKSRTTGAAFQYSNGLSIFFPWADLTDVEGTSEIEVYKDLSWALGGYWDDFLTHYVKKTQRLPRGCGSVAVLEADQAKPLKDRIFRKSRLNRKFGKYKGVDGSSRYWPPWSKYWPPWSKQGSGKSCRIGDMKNPPIYYPK